ncbi:MAG: FHA domain-containing protein [Acutalibacteraceae bacterium]|nr:FHA domain-containing protein [Acutalibacteraceae bacterium]
MNINIDFDIATVARYAVPVLCLIITAYCIKHLLQSKAPKVTPASLIDELTGDEYLITNWETSVGRSNACDIVLDYPSVSRFHAVISKHKKGWIITDTNSSSGTTIGKTKVERSAVVNDGDTVSFGGIVLRFRIK